MRPGQLIVTSFFKRHRIPLDRGAVGLKAISNYALKRLQHSVFIKNIVTFCFR